MNENEKKPKETWKEVLTENLYEFYTQSLMQNQFSYFLWVLTYIISYVQIIDFLFHYYYDVVYSESLVSSVIVSILEYSSVLYILYFIASYCNLYSNYRTYCAGMWNYTGVISDICLLLFLLFCLQSLFYHKKNS